MANFNTHLSGGFLISALFAIVGYKAGILNNHELILCTIFGTTGSLLPDIDSNNSTPIKIGFNTISVVAAFSLVIYWRSSLPLIQMIMLWGLVFVIIRYLVFELFTSVTVHRGVIHSVPYMAMLAMSVTSFNFYYLETSIVTSWLYGLFLFIGSMVHLILDEMYSVNLLNMKVKRSFGTAFKIYRHKEAIYFLLIYAILCLLIFYSPPFLEFWEEITDPITWLILKKSVI